MSRFLVSGLVNVETTCRVSGFPVAYQPIDYSFFGVAVNVGGVGYNLACALAALGDEVTLTSMVGRDLPGSLIREQIEALGVTGNLTDTLEQTPTSVILYDNGGKRRIFCDLKNIQEERYDFSAFDLTSFDLVAVCNINFNRPLLRRAKEQGVRIATDVHVLGDAEDGYNREFMEYADVLFLSNEAIVGREEAFVRELARRYHNDVIVVGCGGEGALLFLPGENRMLRQPAARPDRIVNTVGTGDALFSAFLSLCAKGFPLETCLSLAQKFAAHKIGFDGAAKGFLTMQELTASPNQ